MLQLFERIAAIHRCQGGTSVALEARDERLTDIGIVIDDEDAALARHSAKLAIPLGDSKEIVRPRRAVSVLLVTTFVRVMARSCGTPGRA